MSFIRRKWTPAAADWTKEDWITILISPLACILLTLGIALILLLNPIGYLMLAAGVAVTVLGMTFACAATLLGLLLAWRSYRKYGEEKDK